MDDQLAYYRARLEQERKRAQEAEDRCAERAHREMAKRYEAIVQTGDIPTGRIQA